MRQWRNWQRMTLPRSGLRVQIPSIALTSRIREVDYLTSLISWSLTKSGRGFESPIRYNIEVEHRYLLFLTHCFFILSSNFLLISGFSSWVSIIETLCNGSTKDFGSFSQSSNLYVSTILSYGVMVTQKILVLLFWVRILVAQQKIKKYHKDFFENQIHGIIDL